MLLSDYVSEFASSHGVSHVFGVTGGYAMFLNNSFGVNGKLKNIFSHNEQGAGYTAVGYSKSSNKPCIVSTTAGVAATNTISSVLVAWQESLPILYISGQVNKDETVKANPSLRHYSGQDCNICEIVKSITKYSHEVHESSEIKYHLQRAMYELTNGRSGPCFLSIPIDIQNSQIEPDELSGFTPENNTKNDDHIEEVIHMINESKRPLLLVGNGVKMSDGVKLLNQFVNETRIPVVASYNGIDTISSISPMYIGRCGINGDRPGNFAIQNCDLLITLGCRMALCLVGYNRQTFSRESKKIMVDVDQNELSKNDITIDLKICDDVKNFLLQLMKHKLPICESTWQEKTLRWKTKWFNDLPPQVEEKSPYAFYKKFMEVVPNSTCLISSSGSIHTPLVHSFNDYGKNIKFIMNSATGDMGSEVPGSLGIHFTGLYDNVICVVGDGSFMFNLQELQTISHHNTNIKIVIMNNNGYESIRVSQKNYFGNLLGTDASNGLSFPSFKKVADVFCLGYSLFDGNFEKLYDDLSKPGCRIIEVICTNQDRHPKLSSKRDETTGQFVSRPLEDMFPFIDRDEFKDEMIITPI
jgi:acetolactate synthase-1/2/3 large subunit